MTDHPRKALFPNPFYVILLVSSTMFVMTALGYLISPAVADRPGARTGSLALAAWLDRHGPGALAVELIVMLVSALLSMATDRWFPSRAPHPGAASGPGSPTDVAQGS
ncbi:MAG: hypothetical protein JO116_12600 [Planctomycetaceae bacterium]|nr:hypothetical protein [Planctomycetaceae bacterium]MBV8606281.1 hypothetical protein [Singulisphaera sp.]